MIVLLYAEFGTLRHVALILGVVPLAMLGGLIALHVTGVTLNVASGVGFIALFGVAVMNGVIMVSYLNRVRDRVGVSLVDRDCNRRRRTAAARADDGDRRNARHAAGGTCDRGRQRRAAQHRDRGGRRPHPGDAY